MNTVRSFNVITGPYFFKYYHSVKDITAYHLDIINGDIEQEKTKLYSKHS